MEHVYGLLPAITGLFFPGWEATEALKQVAMMGGTQKEVPEFAIWWQLVVLTQDTFTLERKTQWKIKVFEMNVG